ncbi:TPA: single-stranded DNA-binding protein [Clostridioides difficile]|nr:single-stranded DNA-binding protein [Clostridioides difficile]
MNSVVLVGRLTKDAKVTCLSGTEVNKLSFTMAVDRNYKNSNGEKETDFIHCEKLGKSLAITPYLKKGRLIGVFGSLRIDNFLDEHNQRKIYTKVFIKNIQLLASNNLHQEGQS